MLYVAGEILLWMLLAAALGVLAGWFVWGLRSRDDDQRTAAEHQRQLATVRGEAEQLRAQNEELLALHARDASTIARLQQSASGDAAPLAARIAELEGVAHEADLLRRRVFELEKVAAEADGLRARVAELEGGGGPPTVAVAPVPVEPAAEPGADPAEIERLTAQVERLQTDVDTLRTRFTELGKAFGGQVDLGDPATVRVRWAALQARAAESDQLAQQLGGLRAVLGGELDPAELQERFTELEERASEADELRARLSQLEGGG